MAKLARDAVPTMRQYTVLQTLHGGWNMTAKQIGVRSDVLWRMEEAGWVARDLRDVWYILPLGEQAIERWRERAGI